ncbi:ABC transporter permease [Deinococcus cellulosilyticus]|uniref:Sugar ABC transporter permease n=1 Tax=Deinococcus cellulosilyticus (strain DSM 18568 / NBRC 106333 / KACC 11606 / 5516J-15) TaxID=1223518 RepID=A0A511N0C9_DEIC1|nr:ABC transporter permease [Deinococcus cellulosilyticus]GEM46293.1 sugar ABC transporter permease [Deinococcus cellulosilyticus NBRC 106333 = KACC 11606]
MQNLLRQHGALVALVLLLLFAGLRYQGFLGEYNLESFLRYNAMFGLIALGMTFVIITGGIDLSVGSMAAFASVIAALVSPHGVWLALLVPVLLCAALGFLNGFVISRFKVMPFVVTLGMFLIARGLALIASGKQTVLVNTEGGVGNLGQGDFLGLPIPAWMLLVLFAVGALFLAKAPYGRYALTIGGNEEAARLMGIPVEKVKLLVYTLSGALAGLAGVILASQFSAGQPTEGVGWELTAIASVVVGGTLLTGGRGSVLNTLVGVILLGMIFTVLNFENGLGHININSYWQTVIRGLFLLAVVLLQSPAFRGRLRIRPGT